MYVKQLLIPNLEDYHLRCFSFTWEFRKTFLERRLSSICSCLPKYVKLFTLEFINWSALSNMCVGYKYSSPSIATTGHYTMDLKMKSINWTAAYPTNTPSSQKET